MHLMQPGNDHKVSLMGDRADDEVLSVMIFRAPGMNQAAMMMQNGQTNCCTQHYAIGIQTQGDWSSGSQEKKSYDLGGQVTHSFCGPTNNVGKISSIEVITVLTSHLL
jgi:hypothetical protein